MISWFSSIPTHHNKVSQNIHQGAFLSLLGQQVMKTSELHGSNFSIKYHNWHINFIGPWIYVVILEQIWFGPANIWKRYWKHLGWKVILSTTAFILCSLSLSPCVCMRSIMISSADASCGQKGRLAPLCVTCLQLLSTVSWLLSYCNYAGHERRWRQDKSQAAAHHQLSDRSRREKTHSVVYA